MFGSIVVPHSLTILVKHFSSPLSFLFLSSPSSPPFSFISVSLVVCTILTLYVSFCLSLSLCLCLSVCVSVCLSVSFSLSMSLCLSLSLSLSVSVSVSLLRCASPSLAAPPSVKSTDRIKNDPFAVKQSKWNVFGNGAFSKQQKSGFVLILVFTQKQEEEEKNDGSLNSPGRTV